MLRYTTCYCILTYALPITGKTGINLLERYVGSVCDSGVIFGLHVLVSGLHCPRFAVKFHTDVLSPSLSFDQDISLTLLV